MEGDVQTPEPSIATVPPKPRVIYHCKICDHPFAHKHRSRQHEYTHMNARQLKELRKEKQDIFQKKCITCNILFFDKYSYNSHLKSETHTNVKEYPCHLCRKRFAAQWTLNSHLVTQHGDEKSKQKFLDSRKYACPFPNCGSKFPSRTELTRHGHTHSTEKQFKCTKCDKYFQTPKSRTRHTKIHDVTLDGGYKFSCYFCEKKFTASLYMTRHLRTHFNEYDFACQICGQEFLRKDSLQYHMAGVHEGIRPYDCLRCSKSFVRRCDLDIHFKRMHAVNYGSSKVKPNTKL